MNYFQILDCSDLGTCCSDYALAMSLNTIRKFMSIVQIIAPIILILMAVVELTLLMMDPEKKNGLKNTYNKIMAATIIFSIPIMMDAVLSVMPDSFSVSACWDEAKVIAEKSKNTSSKYVDINPKKKKKTILTDPDSYQNSNPAKNTDSNSSSSTNTAGSASGVLEGAKKVHTTYEQEQWAYYDGYGDLKWNDINYSTNNPSKKTCCATFVGSALYVGGVFTESEINKYNYNDTDGISDLCQNNGWTKITSYSDLAAGDIVIMTSNSSGGAPGHVQIYAGNGTWYNAGSTDAIRRENPYSSDASGRFLYAWRKP